MNTFIKWVFFAGHDKDVYEKLNTQFTQTNGSRLTVFSSFLFAACAVMAAASFIVPEISGMRYTYVTAMLISLIILGSVRLFGNNEKLVAVMVYFFIVTVLAFGIIIGTVLSPRELSAAYIALLLTAPQLFVGKPYRMHWVTLAMNLLFIYMVIQYKNPVTWSSDIINSLIFYSVSVLLTTFSVNSSVERYLMEKRIRELAEVDQLTGLLNRNSYELELLKASRDEKESVFCVYVDVNGLHELNNRMGHEAGDKMLIFVGKAMQRIFGEEHSYRIGGDEFVAFGYNCSESEISRSIEKLRTQIEDAGYHAAIGCSREEAPDILMQRIIKNAETMMYGDKKAYYDSLGIKRI